MAVMHREAASLLACMNAQMLLQPLCLPDGSGLQAVWIQENWCWYWCWYCSIVSIEWWMGISLPAAATALGRAGGQS